jgi:two-component system NtrC family sensor kinase
MEDLLKDVDADLRSPELAQSCITCHAQSENQAWREVQPRLESLTKLVAAYHEHVSETISATNKSHREQKDAMGLYLSRTIVVQAHELEDGFDRMTSHLVSQYHEWAGRTGRTTVAVILAGLLLVTFFMVRMIRQILKPIVKLERAAREMSAGRYPDRLEIHTRDELETLAATFNRMVDSIREATREREDMLTQTRDFNTELEARIQAIRHELEAAQATLVRNETLSAIGTLASGVAHEINNPIHVIMGMVDLILKEIPDGPLAEDLRLIESETARCQKIVSQLLDFSRQHEPEWVEVRLDEIIRETVELVAARLRKAGVECRFLPPDPPLPTLILDPSRIKQVMINLLVNAQQAMPSGGRIAVTAGRDEADGEWVVIRVRDNGEGIPTEIQGRIFEPFFTTKTGREGTGLGLSITHRIVEEHGGRILVVSQPGQGTEFSVWLPIKQPMASAERSEKMARLERASA